MSTPRRTRQGSLQSDQVSELKLLIKESKSEILNVLRQELKSVRQEINSLTSRFTALEESVQSIQKKQVMLETEISAVKSGVESITEASLQEMDGRLRRTANVIIRGLPEVTGSVEERAKQDKRALAKVLEDIDAASVNISDLGRIGKQNGDKPRLLRVSFLAAAERLEVLRKARRLRDSARFTFNKILPGCSRSRRNYGKSFVIVASGEKTLCCMQAK